MPQVRRWLKLTPLIGFRPRACLSCPRSQSSSVGVCGCKTRACHSLPMLPRLPGQRCQNPKRQRGVRRGSSQHEGTRGRHVRGTEGRGRTPREGGGGGGCAKARRCLRLQARRDCRCHGLESILTASWCCNSRVLVAWRSATPTDKRREGLAFEFRAAIPQSPEIRLIKQMATTKLEACNGRDE